MAQALTDTSSELGFALSLGRTAPKASGERCHFLCFDPSAGFCASLKPEGTSAAASRVLVRRGACPCRERAQPWCSPALGLALCLPLAFTAVFFLRAFLRCPLWMASFLSRLFSLFKFSSVNPECDPAGSLLSPSPQRQENTWLGTDMSQAVLSSAPPSPAGACAGRTRAAPLEPRFLMRRPGGNCHQN